MQYSFIIQGVYLLATTGFILGLKRMSSPKTARSGIECAGIGVLVAVIATLFLPQLGNLSWILLAMVLGALFAWIAAKKVSMTAMPEMIALYNGMGGGAAAAIAAVELMKLSGAVTFSLPLFSLAIAGALIGSIALSGSLLAFLKLRNWLKNIHFAGQQKLNLTVLVGAVILGVSFYFVPMSGIGIAFFAASLSYGVLMTLGIGGADMPVVISFYNALTGLAVACEGLVLNNVVMVIAGTLVGAAGVLLTLLMAKAMNRSLFKIIFTHFGTPGRTLGHVEGEHLVRTIEAFDAAMILNFVNRVIFVPGYGLAVAQAQQKIWELAALLLDKGVEVKFAIHPVAGRMPGHMNVLLAEAGVPYDYIFDMETINSEFATTDAVVVIGANDVVNPAAREDVNSPLYGMPILNVDAAKQIFVVKRGSGHGYAGVENTLFQNAKCQMIYGDAKQVLSNMFQALKEA